MLRETGAWNDTLLRTVKTNTKSPAVIVLVKHTD